MSVRIEENKSIEIDEQKVSYIRNLHVGYDKEDFILAFNGDDDKFEKVFAISAENMRDLVMLLFQAGVEFQKENHIDIGFGMGDEDNECTEDISTKNE